MKQPLAVFFCSAILGVMPSHTFHSELERGGEKGGYYIDNLMVACFCYFPFLLFMLVQNESTSGVTL